VKERKKNITYENTEKLMFTYFNSLEYNQKKIN